MFRASFIFIAFVAAPVLSQAQDQREDSSIPLPTRSAVMAPQATPTPATSPTPSPSPSPAASPTPAPTAEQHEAVAPQPDVTPIPLPPTEATVGPALDTEKTAADAVPSPTPDPLEAEYGPAALGLPDVLSDEPLIPQDLLSPIPRPPTTADSNTVQSSEETLKKLRRAAQGVPMTASAKKMNLDEAIAYALANNPDVLDAIQQIRLTQGQVISVRSQALPQLTATSAYQYQEQSLVGGGGSSGSVIELAPDLTIELPGRGRPQNQQWNLQIAANQLLFDGGGAISAIRAAKFIEDSTYFQLRQTIDQVIAEVKINFFQIILNRALILAQEQSVALLESQLQDQINRFEAGTVPRFNVLQAEVALANSIPPLIQARNNLRISQFQLVKLLGMNYDQTNPAEVPFNVVGNLNFIFRKINTDESIRTALIQSPFLKAQRQVILAQAANINVQLAGYFPRINASAGYQVQNNPASLRLHETLEGWFFGFTGSWNIFDGLETAGNVQQAKAQLQQAKINYDDSVRGVILTVQEAISNLQEARETIDSQQASVTQATEALRLSRERLDAGAGTQLDVLNAQVQLLQAQTTELQARFDYIQALAVYDAALSLDAKWEESFDDPMASPERRKFIQINAPDRQQPPLPRALRATDPLSQILTPEAAASPSPSPADNSNRGD